MHARVYAAALGALGAEPREAWMAGDNIKEDMAAPRRARMRGIRVDGAGAGLPGGSRVCPDRIIRHIGELVEGI